jgi:hypothetical protein
MTVDFQRVACRHSRTGLNHAKLNSVEVNILLGEEKMNARIFLGLLMIFTTRVVADTPGFMGPSIFASEGGAVFARVSYRNPDDQGKYEAYGTVYRLKNDGSDEALWSFSGISTFHRIEVFLCVDMAHMVIVAPRIAGHDLKKEDWGISFYDRGQLLKRYSPSELVVHTERLVRSTSSYFWLARNMTSTAAQPSGMELGFYPARSFWLRTVDGVLYEFDSYTGDIVKKEPNQAAQTTPGLRPSVSDL